MVGYRGLAKHTVRSYAAGAFANLHRVRHRRVLQARRVGARAKSDRAGRFCTPFDGVCTRRYPSHRASPEPDHKERVRIALLDLLFSASFGTDGGERSHSHVNVTRTAGTRTCLDYRAVSCRNATFVHCAVAADGVYCWGTNTRGEVGNNSRTAQRSPVRVLDLPTPP